MEPEEDPKFSFVGNWLGSWSDNLFTNIRVSAMVVKTNENSYGGSFFIDQGNGAYTPCCGGESNNGSIFFTTEGNQVLSFKYIQNAPDYKGGCPGEYDGEGAISVDETKLVINFTGTDCDGFHDNGVFIFELDD